MKQRIPRRAWRSAAAGHRPRVLIEDDHPALAVSDFSLFQQAGFDVAFCSGPGPDPAACPLRRGEGCPAVGGADAVLHNLDPGLGIAAGIRSRFPGLPVIVAQCRRPDGSLPPVPPGCTPLAYPCSVKGQIAALWQALTGGPA